MPALLVPAGKFALWAGGLFVAHQVGKDFAPKNVAVAAVAVAAAIYVWKR